MERKGQGLEFELGAARPSKRNSEGRSLTESWFTSSLVFMRATIEIDDELYRRVKAAAAIRGRKVKDLVAEGLRTVLGSSHTGLHARRIQLPILKSKKPGTLRLSLLTLKALFEEDTMTNNQAIAVYRRLRQSPAIL